MVKINISIDQNTLALLHFNDKDNVLKDEIGKLNWNIDRDVVSINSDITKFGNSLNVSGGIIKSSNFQLDGDLTIDFWVYLYTTSYCEILLSINEYSTQRRVMIQRDGNRNSMYLYEKSGSAKSINGLYNNKWNHVAYVSDYNNGYTYIYKWNSLCNKQLL